MRRVPPSDPPTYREAATARAHPSTRTIGQLVTLGLLDGRPTPFGPVVTRVSVEQLRRWRWAESGDLGPEDCARRPRTARRRAGSA